MAALLHNAMDEMIQQQEKEFTRKRKGFDFMVMCVVHGTEFNPSNMRISQ